MLGSKIKILGLCTLALAVMAVSAGSAQAEPGAFWLVSGAKISESLLPTFAVAQEGTGKLLAKLGANTFHITCTETEAIGAHLVEPVGSLLGKIKFKGCKFFSLNKGGAGEELKSCEPFVGAEKGVIETVEGKGLILLHKFKMENGEELTEQVIDLEPKVGINFVTISLGELCSIGEKITVGGVGTTPGKLVVKDCEGKALVDQVIHLVEENKALTKLAINGNEANTASLDASANVFLTGAHLNKTWAAHS